tara:strand:+ start:4813 stop:5994 length:1182 start_codon:yes stop_codon:yes gene_type:complete
MIRTDSLKSALGLIKNAVAKKRALSEILTSIHVSLDSEKQTMTLTGTDLETASRARIKYEGEQDASFMFEPTAVNAIQRLSDEMCTIDVKEHLVKLTSGRVRLSLPSKDADSFPEMSGWDDLDDKWGTPIASEYLESLFFSVVHATSKDNSRPALCGIRFLETDEELSVFATDGHRLAWAKAPKGLLPDMLLPAAALPSISKSIKQADSVQVAQHKLIRSDTLALSHDNVLAMRGTYQVLFAGDGDEDEIENIDFFHSFRLLEKGQFPPIQTVMETQTAFLDKEIKINVSPIRKAIEVARLFDETQRCVLSFDTGKIFIDSSSSAGAAHIDLDLTSDLPEALKDLKIGVNAKYIIDAMASCQDDEVTMRIYDGTKPMSLDDGVKLELIMPMRT